MQVRGLDLNQEWQRIRREMLRLVSELVLENPLRVSAWGATVFDPDRIVLAKTTS